MKKLFVITVFVLLASLADVAGKTANWAPAGNDIRTRWAAEVNPANPLPEYPRPQMVRDSWMNLNGLWNYAITSLNTRPEVKGKFVPDGQILVPFAVESSLSGVGRMVGRDHNLWYERSFTIPKSWNGKRILLHFGAVDWKAEVWVNGIRLGEHTGGYTPFYFDMTDGLKKKGSQTLRIKVFDATDQTWQPRGKQVASPEGIWYTPVTGIWQTVWMEAVEPTHINSYLAISDIDNASLYVHVDAIDLQNGDVVRVELQDGGSLVSRADGTDVTLPVPGMKTWSPDAPFLYGLQISIIRNGKVLDLVQGYAAMRKVSKICASDGFNRIGLNNKPIFQFGPLDQGWWPDGLYTAPTDEALRFDIERTKAWGFNMIRKHIKVEPARWYYWCDVLGMMVWQDMPCIADHGGNTNALRDPEIREGQSNRWVHDSFLGGTDCKVPQWAKDNYYKEWGEIIAALKGFPCIEVWVPFNEAWGQFDTEAVVEFTRRQDPTRLVNEASGGNYHFTGDIQDIHNYPEPKMKTFEWKLINVLGEYGGIGFPIPGHLWKEKGSNWGYGGVKASTNEVMRQYEAFAERLSEFVTTGCAAAVYTQTTDVEIEVNGLMTYDRIEKIDASWLKKVNEKVIATPLFDAERATGR